MLRKAQILFIIALAITIAIQFTGERVTNPPTTGKISAPAEVMAIFERSCFNCHSNETDLTWYDNIAPISWVIAADVKEARSRFNFSEWDKMSPADQKGKLWQIFNMVDGGRMPLKKYTAVHSSARISAADVSILKNYINSLTTSTLGDTAKIHAADMQFNSWKQSHGSTSRRRPRALNGIEYFPDYRNWQVMSTTSRVDNGTMRIVYGNDTAIKALKNNQINPWPNGATIVKVVWDKLEDGDGNIRAGKFYNVQFMIKDSEKYKNTEGWGFARFDTPELIPYGKVLASDAQCINCHQLVKQNGFVFDISTQAINE